MFGIRETFVMYHTYCAPKNMSQRKLGADSLETTKISIAPFEHIPRSDLVKKGCSTSHATCVPRTLVPRTQVPRTLVSHVCPGPRYPGPRYPGPWYLMCAQDPGTQDPGISCVPRTQVSHVCPGPRYLMWACCSSFPGVTYCP